MYQIDNSTAAAVLPTPTAPGTPGYYTDGNPSGGVPATIVPAEHLNMMMMEIINVILAAGIPLDKDVYTQLRDALTTLGLRPATTSNAGVVELATALETQALVDGTRAVTPAGLATLLATSLVPGLVQLATTADAQAMTDTAKALTPAKLSDAFKGANQSLVSTGGYQKLPGGLVIQWGIVTPPNTTTNNFTLPISFPTAGLAGAAVSRGANVQVSMSGVNQTNIGLQSNQASITAFFLVVGY